MHNSLMIESTKAVSNSFMAQTSHGLSKQILAIVILELHLDSTVKKRIFFSMKFIKIDFITTFMNF